MVTRLFRPHRVGAPRVERESGSGTRPRCPRNRGITFGGLTPRNGRWSGEGTHRQMARRDATPLERKGPALLSTGPCRFAPGWVTGPEPAGDAEWRTTISLRVHNEVNCS